MKNILISSFIIFFVFYSQAQIIDIPDPILKDALVNMPVANLIPSNYVYQQNYNVYTVVDTNGDGEIQVSEAENVYGLRLDDLWDISSMSGIEYFINIEFLDIDNNDLISLDISNNTNLKYLSIYANDINSLDLSNNILLDWLDVSGNDISTIDISMLEDLRRFACYSNLLTDLNLDNNTELEFVSCYNNSLTTLSTSGLVNLTHISAQNNALVDLDLTNNYNLSWLRCEENQLTSLDLSNNPNLTTMLCFDNQIESLDLSNNPNDGYFSFYNNPLISLNIKNGLSHADYYFFALPYLEYICADNDEIEELESFNLPSSPVINSYCSFTPGGEYYTIEGESRVDANTNGCDVGDNFYPNIKLELTDGTNAGTYLADTSGSYSVPVSEGMHTMTPVLENPDYFTVSPTSSIITFPDAGGSYVQDFCLSPNGIHNDVEVVIVPTSGAVPGFDSYYTILYRNKGNIELNGTVSLDFEDDYMDFISALPAETISSIGNLQWNYSNLQPFETRAIEVVFNLNTPTDITFPLNDGDVLDFDISIDPIVNDETISDNTFSLKEIVVNSYDPNDVTCLEGVAILPEHVGEYVHYRIRFENLGTANATNIVVKDVIDTTKFDVSSLIPLHASHNYTARIRENNIIEFIFEGINLPFDDANNDGYVVFKIKTLETLQLGDTFTNQAEIYFDFNFPVITNMYSTSVQENLGINDFEINDVALFPNPVNNQLYIKSNYNINTIKIFDINGRLIQNKTMSYSNTQNKVSVSILKPGIYFVEVYSNGQKEVLRFIKK